MTSRSVRLAAVAALLTALASPAAGQAPLEHLRGYLRIDTSNPPGNEKAAALYLKGLLDRAGIASELLEPAPGRASLYARLKGTGARPGLILHHHMDVVPADPREWASPPFAAREEGVRITARGALDDKALGIAELEAFVALRKSGGPLARDVVYLATADEETGGSLGVETIRKQRPGWLAGIGAAIGEGGTTETVIDRQRYFGIEVAQKSALWLRLTAKGPGGHPASPDPANAAARLARALGALASWQQPIVVEPAVAEALAALAPVRPKDMGALLQDAERLAKQDPARLRGGLTPRTLSLLSDTLAITRLGPEKGATNVLPGVAWAELDCRLLPSTDSKAFLKELAARIAPERLQIDVLLDAPAGPASPKGDLYTLLSERLRKRFPGALVGPDVSPGLSENRVFRMAGIAAYGLTPFRVNAFDQAGIHGANERIRTDWFLEGVETLKEIVAAYAAP